MPSSRATAAIGRPVLRTSSTASRLNSLVNPRRVRCGVCLYSSPIRTSSHPRCPASGGRSTLARELGLQVAHLDPIGWSATSVPDPTAACYVEVLAELGAALVLWRRAEQASPTGPGRSRNALACTCACGRRIRVARSVLELAPILCAACAQPFKSENDQEGWRVRACFTNA